MAERIPKRLDYLRPIDISLPLFKDSLNDANSDIQSNSILVKTLEFLNVEIRPFDESPLLKGNLALTSENHAVPEHWFCLYKNRDQGLGPTWSCILHTYI
ncbi:nucleosome assembly protein [Striga asiatica]|uniref:Nucleosome assembly protein n=1 Tax=Striga asiatica TaxID=4170 RepID=A0A5A7RB80_STRAF|nr:nucleosome assembly protein [Striga asiatica]